MNTTRVSPSLADKGNSSIEVGWAVEESGRGSDTKIRAHFTVRWFSWYNRLKIPNWWEARQFNVYKHRQSWARIYRETAPAKWSERDFYSRPPGFKSDTLTTQLRFPLLKWVICGSMKEDLQCIAQRILRICVCSTHSSGESKSKVCTRAGQVAHQARAYQGFCSIKRLGVFLLPPGWDTSPSQGYPQH